MAKFTSILTILLALAVGYLLFDKFSSGEATDSVESDTTEAVVIEEGLVHDGQLAFVNIDSLNAHYTFLDDKKDELDAEQGRAQRRVQNKMQKAQDRALELQKAAETMTTEDQYFAAQQEMQNLETDIQKYQERLGQELLELETTMATELNERISNYLSDYNSDKGYDYVLGVQEGGQILYGKPALDITSAVIDGLNELYTAEKAAAAAK